MKLFIVIATLFLASLDSSSASGAISNQYHTQDHIGQYSYGYADPNSQKHESRLADGTTKGAYSYVDGYGHVQSVSYVADPHTGFHVSGTNLPKAPVALHAVAAPLAYAAYAAPYVHHVPLTPHGVPVDTPEVQHAKAAHFAAHAAARTGHHLYKRSLWGHGYAAPWAYAQHVPVIHNGVPVETPEVQHAKAAHFAAHAKALGHAAPHGPIDTPEVQHAKAAHFAAHAAARLGHPAPAVPHGGYHIPVIHNGVPVDTPEVQHAKAAHFAAVAKASAEAAHAGPGHYAPAHHHGPIHIPVIHNGVPVETPEVQHAKAAHLAALAEAQSRSYDHGHYDDGQYRNSYHGW